MPHALGTEEKDQPSSEHRHYHVRLTWADRATLLRSVGATRLRAVCWGLILLSGLYGIRNLWSLEPPSEMDRHWTDSAMQGLTVLMAAQFALMGSICFLLWRYADRVQELAGGSTASMRAWSQLHYRIEWLYALAMAFTVATTLAGWFVQHAVMQHFREAIQATL